LIKNWLPDRVTRPMRVVGLIAQVLWILAFLVILGTDLGFLPESLGSVLPFLSILFVGAVYVLAALWFDAVRSNRGRERKTEHKG
jgi:uncharacterized membrane-anchored protein